MIIRKAELDDAAQIAEIYNFYVLNTHHSFEIEPVEFNEMNRRVSDTIEDYPFLIAEENGEVLGYVFATCFKPRSAYKNSVEVFVYVKNDLEQKGIGTRLYKRLSKGLSKMMFTRSSPEFLCQTKRAIQNGKRSRISGKLVSN